MPVSQRGALRAEDVECVAVRTGVHREPPAVDGRRTINVDHRLAGVNIVIVGTFASAAAIAGYVESGNGVTHTPWRLAVFADVRLTRAAQEARSKSSWNSITPWSSMETTTKDVGATIS